MDSGVGMRLNASFSPKTLRLTSGALPRAACAIDWKPRTLIEGALAGCVTSLTTAAAARATPGSPEVLQQLRTWFAWDAEKSFGELFPALRKKHGG